MKKIVTGTIAALAVLVCTGLPALGGEVRIEIDAEGYSEADAMVALEIFRRNCRPLGEEFWSDVTEARVDIRQETAPHRLARGWKADVHLSLKYSDEPQVGPSYASGAGILRGHTLHYNLGGGETPGFLATKQSSQYLCGLSFDDKGDDLFVPVPEFIFLDR